MFTFKYVGSDDVAFVAEANTAYAALEEMARKRKPIMGLELAGLDLTGLNLPYATITQCNLAGAKLDDAKLAGTHFPGCNLEGASFQRADLTSACFDDCLCNGTDFRRAALTFARFFHARLAGARLDDCNMMGADFRNAWMNKVTLYGAQFGGANFEGANLINAGFDLKPESVHLYIKYVMTEVYPTDRKLTQEQRNWVYDIHGIVGMMRDIHEVFMGVVYSGELPYKYKVAAEEVRHILCVAIRSMPDSPRRPEPTHYPALRKVYNAATA